MADNNLDPEEIRRLNESVKELADNTTGLGSSFGSFGTTTTNTKNTVQKLNQELDKLLKKTTALNQTTTESSRSGSRATKGFTTVSESSKELGKNFKGLNKATESLINQFNELGKTISKLAKGKVSGTGEIASAPGTLGPLRLSDFEIQLRSIGKKLNEHGEVVNSITAEERNILKEKTKEFEKEKRLRDIEDKKELLRDRAKEEGGKVFRELTEKYKDSNAIFNGLNEKIFELTGKSALLAGGWALLSSVGKGVVDATSVMSREIYNGARGASVSAKALKAFTDEVGSATTAIGVALMLIPGMGAIRWALRGLGAVTVIAGQAIKKYGEFNEKAAEQVDKQFKSFNDLSKSGVVLTGGIEDVSSMMQQLGMTLPEIEEFTKLIGANNTNLKYLGATSADGAKQFVQLAEELTKSELGTQFQYMGITIDQQRAHTLQYMAQQTRMGMAQFKTQQELLKSSGEYIKELNLIAQLTGATREEQEEDRKAVLAIDELRMAQFEAEEAKDFKRAAILEEMAKAASILMRFDKRGATGFAQAAALEGGIASPEAAAAMSTYGKIFNRIASGQAKTEQIILEIPGALKETLMRYSQTLKVPGGLESLQGGLVTGKTSDLIDAIQRLNPEAVAKAAKEQKMSVDEYLQKLASGEIKPLDKATKDLVDAANSQRNAALLQEGVVKAYNGAAVINERASKAFEKAVGEFSSIVKGIKPGMFNTGAPQGAKTTPAPTAAPAQSSQVKTEERLAQLNLKDRQETAGGGAVSNELLSLAENIQQAIPGTRFTALNDLYHQKNLPNSKHAKGKALDFTTNPRPQNAEEAAGIKQQIYAMGANKVLDEYFADRNANTKGGHFHAEVARYGGAFSGPNSGYPVILHKDEVAFKTSSYQALLSDASNSLTNYRNEVSKQPISSITPLSTQPNAGKLLTELISMTDDNNRLILSELYKSRLIQEDMLNALRST